MIPSRTRPVSLSPGSDSTRGQQPTRTDHPGKPHLVVRARRPIASLVVVALAQVTTAQEVDLATVRPTPAFVANHGQWPAEVRFRYQHGPATAWLHDDGLTLALTRGERRATPPSGEGSPTAEVERATAIIRIAFEGAGAASRARGENRLGARHNFYLGRDASRWAAAVPAFASVVQPAITTGVDATWQHRDGRLAYDLHVGAGVNAAAVVTRIDGARSLRVGPEGRLIVESELGDVALTAPRSWEVTAGGRRDVASRFVVLDAQRYRIEVDRLDQSVPLVVDPGLEWGTYLGGSKNEALGTVRVDRSDYIYVTGWTQSPDFPVTTTPVFGGGNVDIFVSCLDPNVSGNSTLVWSTYLGGSSNEVGNDLHVTADGNTTTVVGLSDSADLPTTPGAFQTSLPGVRAGVVAQLDAVGARIYASFLGASGSDRICAIESHPAGGFAIAGYSDSADFPATPGSYQPTPAGQFDAFVARFDPSMIGAAQLASATYLGGSGDEGTWQQGAFIYNNFADVVVAPNGAVTVVGETSSSSFPTTASAFARTHAGGSRDAFLSQLDGSLATLLYSTFLGSAGEDGAWAVERNNAGEHVVSGFSDAAGFPVTAGAFQTVFGGGGADGVLCVLDTSLAGTASLRYSTYVGGDGFDESFGLSVESSGVITAACICRGGGFPVTAGAMQTTYTGTLAMGAVVRLDPAGNGSSDLHYGSYVGGGAGGDACVAVAVRADGRAVLPGTTTSVGFAFPGSPLQPLLAGGGDAFVAVADLIPANVTRVGGGSGACTDVDLQIDSMPAPGAPFQLICNEAPAPSGVLIVGTPLQLPIAGIELLVLPAVSVPVFAASGAVRTQLTPPAGITLPVGIRFQYVFATSPSCPFALPLSASDALEF